MPVQQQKTILLVTEESVVAKEEAKTLEKNGYRVFTVHTGEEGVEAVQNRTGIDLVLMDINLGNGMDGTQAAELILKNRDLPLIFLLSHTDPEVVAKTEGIPSYGYVARPSGEAVLIASIKTAFRLFEARMQETKEKETLRESEDLFRILLDQATDPMFSLTPEGRYIYVNRAFASEVGRSADQVIGRSIGEITAKEKVAERLAALRQVVRSGKEKTMEVQVPRTDGDHYYLTTVTPIKDASGKVFRLFCSAKNITERKQIEETLRRSEEKFVKIFKTSPYAVAISRTSDGTYIDVNEGYAQVSGYSRDELIGHSPLPGDLNLWLSRKDREHFAKALRETGEALGMEIQFRRKDGAIRNALLSARVLDFGGDNYHIAIISDITERKEAEQALRKSEEKFAKIFKTSPDAIAVARTSDGLYLEVNESFSKIMGYSREELLGRSPLPSDLGIWTYKKGRDRFVKALRETGEALGFEVTLRRKDGTLRDCILSGRLLNIEGELCHIAIITDITERKQAEDALRRSEERHRVIIQTAMDGFCMIDMDGRFLEVNEAYCRMSGYSEQELLTMDVSEVEAKETRNDVLNHIQLLKSQGETRFETKHRRKDGSLFDVEVSAKYRPTEGGRFEVFLRNIHARKQSEKALRKSQDRLRALSARLQTVREEERASIAREIHDNLGQLLTGIKMDLSWFLRQPHPDPSKLQEKVQGLNQLVDQTVQTVRRISTELRPRVLDDFGLVAALEWQVEEFSKKAGIPCVFRSNVRQLYLEPDQSTAVFRIFQEALTNVARHAEATKVEASLKKNAKGLVLTVRDNGRGISLEEVAKHQSLGLVGMRERALIFGGTVEFQGKNGKGTKVVLSLPIA